MTENLWSRFNDIAKPDEVDQAIKAFIPLDEGDYDMVLTKIEAGETKDFLPCMKVWFKTLENKSVFAQSNLQNLTNPEYTASNIAKAVKFLSDLTETEIIYTNLGALAEFIDAVQTGGTYKVRVSYGKKDLDHKFPQLDIVKDPF